MTNRHQTNIGGHAPAKDANARVSRCCVSATGNHRPVKGCHAAAHLINADVNGSCAPVNRPCDRELGAGSEKIKAEKLKEEKMKMDAGSETVEPSSATPPPVEGRESAPTDGKGNFGCLWLIVVLAVGGFITWTFWRQPKELTPEQRAELGRLAGWFEGNASGQFDVGLPSRNFWRFNFVLGDENQLTCTCALYNQSNAGMNAIFLEKAHLRYDGSEVPGYIEVARTERGHGWKLYAKGADLKSGGRIDSLMLDDSVWGRCILHRNLAGSL